jgi:glycosyltransferase involved in cell wall biosynthesis
MPLPPENAGRELTVVVPAHNEAESLPSTLEELVALCRPRGWPIVVVDDGSSDGTEGVARAAGAVVVRHKVRRGYGGALKSGLGAAQTPWVVTFDADGQHDPAELGGLLDAALAADADLVVGARTHGAGGAYRAAGKSAIRLLARALVPNRLRDLNSGLKLYRTELVQRYLGLCPDSMAFSDVVTLVFLSQKHLVVERPVTVRKRLRGRSKVSTQTAIDTVVEILSLITLFNPLRLFLPLAVAAWIAGLAWGIPIVLRGRGVSVGSMLALVTGVVLFALGLMAEQLAAIRKRQAIDGSDR